MLPQSKNPTFYPITEQRRRKKLPKDRMKITAEKLPGRN
jgi:hypothetical protein